MSNLGFLTLNCWLDSDGVHVWQRHDCDKGESKSMLPHPKWRADGKKVWPSIMCGECGPHAFGTIEARHE